MGVLGWEICRAQKHRRLHLWQVQELFKAVPTVCSNSWQIPGQGGVPCGVPNDDRIQVLAHVKGEKITGQWAR